MAITPWAVVFMVAIPDCVDCNKMYDGQCPVHAYHFSHLVDTPILTRARMTLPAQLKLKYLNNQHTPNNMGGRTD